MKRFQTDRSAKASVVVLILFVAFAVFLVHAFRHSIVVIAKDIFHAVNSYLGTDSMEKLAISLLFLIVLLIWLVYLTCQDNKATLRNLEESSDIMKFINQRRK